MTQTHPPVDLLKVDLGVTGMTCTSCSGRVERKLNKLDGVEATVNYATESATISYAPGKVDPDKLIDTVRAPGQAADLKHRLIISAVLPVPVVLLSMVPALQFTNWQWAVLTMVTPIFFWGGAPFHKATLVNLRHGSFTMDTLVTLGTTAAYLWSL